ncbi:hypothetical protein Tco_1361690 [Tanacetum coccineum]
MGEGSANPTDPHHTPTITQPSTSQPQKTQKPRKPKRKDTQVPQPSGPTYIFINEAVHKELGDRLVWVATTASSLEAEQDNVNITKTRSKATPNEASSQETTSGGGPRRVVSSGDEEDLGEDASKQGRRINAIDADKDITMVNVQDDVDNEIFDVDALTGDEVFAEQEVAAKDVNLTMSEPFAPTKVSAATTTTATIPTPRKGIVITELEPEPVNPKKKDVQIMLDEEAAKKLQAEFNEEERLAREKDEANVALTEEWDDIQAKIEADHELTQRLQAKEQEELSVEEKAKLF